MYIKTAGFNNWRQRLGRIGGEMMRQFLIFVFALATHLDCFGDDTKERLSTGLMACVDMQEMFETSHFCMGEILASAQEHNSANNEMQYLTKSRFFSVGGVDSQSGEKFVFTGRIENNLLSIGPDFRVWYLWLQVGEKKLWYRGELGVGKVELTDISLAKQKPSEAMFTHQLFIRPLTVTNQWTAGQANATWISTLLNCTIDDAKINGSRASGTFVSEASRSKANCKFQITVDSRIDDLPVLVEMFELPTVGDFRKVGKMLARTETTWKKVDDRYFPVKFDGQAWEGSLESSTETTIKWLQPKKHTQCPSQDVVRLLGKKNSDDEFFELLEATFADK
jgi:hypothetical protein